MIKKFLQLGLLCLPYAHCDCMNDVQQQLLAMHNGASEVRVTWIQDEPHASSIFHRIDCRYTRQKPHTFLLVCADGTTYQGRAEPCIQLPVSCHDVKRGQTIQHVEWSTLPCRVATRAIQTREGVLGMEAKGFIKAGQPISEGQVTTPKIVKRGEDVTVRYTTPSFTVTNRGTSKEDGAIDDIIKIQCKNKVVSARVCGKSLANIERL